MAEESESQNEIDEVNLQYKYWNRSSWTTFILQVSLQAVSLTLNIDMGIAVYYFPALQVVLSLLCIYFGLSTVLCKKPISYLMFAVMSVLTAWFFVAYIVWNLTYGY